MIKIAALIVLPAFFVCQAMPSPAFELSSIRAMEPAETRARGNSSGDVVADIAGEMKGGAELPLESSLLLFNILINDGYPIGNRVGSVVRGGLSALIEKNNLLALNKPLTEDVIKQSHYIITQEEGEREMGALYIDERGAYRKCNVLIRTSDREALGPEEVPMAMKEFVDWLNREELLTSNPVLFVAEAFLRFIEIHPFTEANGRTGRFLINLLLLRHGQLPMYSPPMHPTPIPWSYLTHFKYTEDKDVKHLASLIKKAQKLFLAENMRSLQIGYTAGADWEHNLQDIAESL